MSGDRFILGLNFFVNYYSVYDSDKRRVGFAQSKLGKHPPMAVDEQAESRIEKKKTKIEEY